MPAKKDLIYFNGIDATTGTYAIEPMADDAFAKIILKEKAPERAISSYRPMFGIDPRELSQTGWGLILPYDKNNPEASAARNAKILEALNELIQHRKAQAGEYFKIFQGPDRKEGGYILGQDKNDFLRRKGVGAGPVDPKSGVPYYLLIVGSPAEIPYRFQNELDVQYAVGRIDFGDDWVAYANYARSVVLAETGKSFRLPRKVTFFGVENSGDRATEMSSQYLIKPLHDKFKQSHSDWDIDLVAGQAANHARLGELLGGKEMPGLLFTASHGMEFPKGDSRQLRQQGALLCSDWPGPNAWHGPIPEEHYFTGEHLDKAHNLLGMLAFYFACYGGGTPHHDEFFRLLNKDRAEIASAPFIAGLPNAMLSHPTGGALAVVGHVERAWGYSFLTTGGDPHTLMFDEAIAKLLAGYPIGSAIEAANERYAEIAAELTTAVEELDIDPEFMTSRKFAELWTAHNDARGYVVIGDPAVRLSQVAEAGERPKKRPAVVLSEEKVETLKKVDKTQRAGGKKDVVRASTAAGPYAIDPSQSFAPQVSDLTNSLREFSNKIAEAIKNVTDEILTLEVETYSTDDLQAVSAGQTSDAQLRALTRVAFDGDMKNYVPTTSSGGVDHEVWEIHMQMVREAQQNRAQFINAMAEMATNLLKNLK